MLNTRRPSLRRLTFTFARGIIFGMLVNTSLLITFHRNTEYMTGSNYYYQFSVAQTSSQLNRTQDKLNFHQNIKMNTSFATKLIHDLDLKRTQRIAREVRILCWVMTTAENHKTKAVHVKKTWGRHCNILLFISDQQDDSLPAIKVPYGSEGRNGLWAKTVFAFTHVHEKYRDHFDWVMKADDDTYVIVENLRLFLLPYSNDDPVYFGFRYNQHLPEGYMSGGSGYTMSKRAVEQLISQGFSGQDKYCPPSSNNDAEDVNIAKCLKAVGVRTGDSRDSKGRHRFLPFTVADHVNPNQSPKNWWFWNYIYWPMKEGYECCSEEPISFHYLPPTMLYMMEYLVYNVSITSVDDFELATTPIVNTTSPNPLVPIVKIEQNSESNKKEVSIDLNKSFKLTLENLVLSIQRLLIKMESN